MGICGVRHRPPMTPTPRPEAAAASAHVRLEADLAGAVFVARDDRTAAAASSPWVVVVAEADPARCEAAAAVLRATGTVRVEAVASVDALVTRVCGGGVDAVVCGRLDGLPEGPGAGRALAEACPELWPSLLVASGTGLAPAAALTDAAMRLWGRSPTDSPA